MPAPVSVEQFLDLVRKSGLADNALLDSSVEQLRTKAALPEEPKKLASALIRDGILTNFYAEQLLRGVWRGFTIGKYRILERIGSGGMGIVYLGEHKLMGHRVAIKVLPVTLAEHQWFLKRFYREAQAVAALNHPNIVRAFDVDQDGNLHFLVMEYVDGSSLQDIVGKYGPMEPTRAAHYIRQAALGLQHLHEAGLVHRDVKPGNLLLDRKGAIKILDLGLARFFRDGQNESFSGKKNERTMVGTDDYLAPEQIVDSDDVDIRADIYSLGATFYFLLTGLSPFETEELAYTKLIKHLAQRAKPIKEISSGVPDSLVALVEKMMTKNPWARPQTPAAVAQALAPWTQTSVEAPPAKEMPRLCPAVERLSNGEAGALSAVTAGARSSAARIGPASASRSGLLSERVKSAQAAPPTPTPALNGHGADTPMNLPATAGGQPQSDLDLP